MNYLNFASLDGFAISAWSLTPKNLDLKRGPQTNFGTNATAI